MNSSAEVDNSGISSHQYTSQSFSDGNMTRLDAMRKHNAFRMRQQEIKAKLAKDSNLQLELGRKLQQTDSTNSHIHGDLAAWSERNHLNGISKPIEVDEKEETGNTADIIESGIMNDSHANRCESISDFDSGDSGGNMVVAVSKSAAIINEDNIIKSLPTEIHDTPTVPKSSRQLLLGEDIKRPSPRLSPQNVPHDIGRLLRTHYLENVPEENTIEAMLNKKQRQREFNEAFLKAEMTEYVRD